MKGKANKKITERRQTLTAKVEVVEQQLCMIYVGKNGSVQEAISFKIESQ